MELEGRLVKALLLTTFITLILSALFLGVAHAGGGHRLAHLTNEARATRGLTQLRTDPGLHRVAARWSREMSQRDRLSDPAPPCIGGGANTGVTAPGDHAVRRIHRAFMRSDSHRANILYPGFTRGGFAVYRHAGLVWATEVFCPAG